jgi:hypothetical protein
MEITAIAATSAGLPSDSVAIGAQAGQRPLMVQISPAARADIGAALVTLQEAHQANASSGLAGAVDRMRAEFEAMRQRASAPATSAYSQAAAAASPASQLEAVMNQSLKAQTEIFQMALSFNAGLTASQQSQSGIKTLVEKS